MRVGILDLETSMAPLHKPWIEDSYLCSCGFQYYSPGKSYYKDWVLDHDEIVVDEVARRARMFEIQDCIDSVDLLVGHNFKFDMDWLKWYNVDLSNVKVWDTKLAQFMLWGQDKTRPNTLNDCCDFWNIPTKFNKVKTYWDAGRDTRTIPLDTLLPYQKQDVLITGELFKAQYRLLKKKYPQLFKLVEVRNQCLHPVTDIEITGMPFDRETAEYHVKQFTDELKITDAELLTYFGRGDINIASGHELSAALFGGKLKRTREIPVIYSKNVTYKEPYKFTYKSGKNKGLTITKTRNKTLRGIFAKKGKEDYEIDLTGVGFTPPEKTETAAEGVYQTNKNVLKRLKCNSKGGTTIKLKRKVLDLLVHRSKIGKFTETFVGAKKDSGLLYQSNRTTYGRVYPSYNQAVAATGRFTSSNPNGQNFPRSKEDEDGFTNPLKTVFIASRPGGLILVIDLSQLEWRVAAWLSQDPVALQEILNDIDCHLDNAINFFGDAKYRQAAKIMTFRLLYGGSAYAFFMDPLMPDFSQKKWNDIVDSYRHKYHVLTLWQQMNITQVARDNGYLYSPTGRIYKIPKVENKRYPGVWTYSDTCIKNYPVQGTATGDFVPLAMNLIWDRFQAEPWKYQSTNWMGQVHDSIIFDTMPHEVKQVAHMGISCFEQLPAEINRIFGLNVNIPLTGEAEAGPNYGDMCWSVKHVAGQWITKGELPA